MGPGSSETLLGTLTGVCNMLFIATPTVTGSCHMLFIATPTVTGSGNVLKIGTPTLSQEVVMC